MSNLERRSDTRHPVEIPLWFHILLQPNPAEEIRSETFNVSRTGILMRSPLPLKVGSPIALKLRIPTQISGSARTFFRLYGHVVHEVNFGEGQLGYGIQLVRPLLADHSALPRTSGYAAVGRPEILAPPLNLHRTISQLETAVHHPPIPVTLPLR
jgi:PilZ domain